MIGSSDTAAGIGAGCDETGAISGCASGFGVGSRTAGSSNRFRVFFLNRNTVALLVVARMLFLVQGSEVEGFDPNLAAAANREAET